MLMLLGANEKDVNEVSTNINEIIEIAKKAKIDIKPGTPGGKVDAGPANAPSALVRSGGGATAGAGAKLADEVSKADQWAMIDKIKSVTAQSTTELGGSNNQVGALVTGTDSNNDADAKSTEDLAAAANAVNKVLGVLDEIIRRTVNYQLGKIKDAVKEIKYSETNGESTEVKK